MRSQVADRKRELLRLQESLPKLPTLNRNKSVSRTQYMPDAMNLKEAKDLMTDLKQEFGD